jgi:hypothetical protein
LESFFFIKNDVKFIYGRTKKIAIIGVELKSSFKDDFFYQGFGHFHFYMSWGFGGIFSIP